MFEFLLLEGAQAGLNWYTVLQKRENYRQAFDHFNLPTSSGRDLTLFQIPGVTNHEAFLAFVHFPPHPTLSPPGRGKEWDTHSIP
jgi:hypothetical protein